MSIIYEKTLSSNERRDHWVYVPKRLWHLFPPPNVPFEVSVGQYKLKMIMNAYGYLRLYQNFWETFTDLLNFDEEHDTIVFTRKADGSIMVSRKKGVGKNVQV